LTFSVPTDLARRHTAAQDVLDALLVDALAEGYEVEIHAQHTEDGMRYAIALVRRTYAQVRQTPDLTVV